MKIYPSLAELLGDVDELHWDAWLYYRLDEWEANPLSAPIMYLKGDEEQEMDLVDAPGGELPAVVVDHGMKNLLDVQTFQDVIAVQKRNKTDSSPEDYVRAINHYLEYDAFLT